MTFFEKTRVRRDGDDRLAVVRGGGWIATLVLVPFGLTLVGFCCCAGSVMVPRRGLESPLGETAVPQAIFFAVFALVMLAVMGWGVVGRRGVVIDRGRGTLETWWGLLFPFSRTRHALDSVRDVRVVEHTRSSGEHSYYTVYPVVIVVGAQEVIASEPRSREAAERVAAAIREYVTIASPSVADIVMPSDPADRVLAERLLARGIVAKAELERCVMMHRGREGASFAEILLECGLVNEDVLELLDDRR